MTSYIKVIMPFIRKIVDDETWYEGERRHCPVSSSDPVVAARVAEIVLREAPKIRDDLRGKACCIQA